MPISPEPPNNGPLLPPPPDSFEEANCMIQEAWKVAFPSLGFPIELIGGFPSRKSPLVATKGSSKLKVAKNKNFESQLLKEQSFFKVLKVAAAPEQTESTPQTRHLVAAFGVSHPQVSMIHQEILFAPAQHTFLLKGQIVRRTGESY
jgi:hypothetical protein